MKEKKTNILKKVIITIIFIIIFLFLVLLYSYFFGTKGLIVKEYKIIDNNLPTEFYGLKIVHISDIHYGYYYDINHLKELVNKVNEINPDIIIFTGDLIDIDLSIEQIEEITNILSTMHSNIKKYIIKGNMDYKTSNYDDLIKTSGFISLNNTFDIIYGSNSKILISGITSNIIETNSIDSKLEATYNYIDNNDINYKILLIHEPDYITNLKDNTFNLILAGHSHNGQINIPFIGAIYTPNGSKKYYKEYYNTSKGKLYISSGIGVSKLPIRLFNKPSFNFYRLTNK